ncbi:MAG: hypothetical protein GWO87_02145 [Xanthomonadaceae bacterium]|nr:hypothetical protein [Rhodospirillaceae bacterium]NIA17969.1 hypothetical protein [Xanthomonadaceae bacterium]
MKKIFLLFLFIFIISGCNNSANTKFSKLQIKNKIINIEIANTVKARKQGLSGRANLCEDCGMLFIFKNKAVRSFWMNKMNFPLDMVWISNGTIKKITENAIIPVNNNIPIYSSEKKVNWVLEVNKGFCKKYNIKEGDKVKLLTIKKNDI